MTDLECRQLRRGDIVKDRTGDEWVVTDFTHQGERTFPTVVRTMTVTFLDPWTKKEVPNDRP
jgi:hypothetical protein